MALAGRAGEPVYPRRSSTSAGVPAQTRVVDDFTFGSGGSATLDLPTGHLWLVSGDGVWSDVDSGGVGNRLFSSSLDLAPTGTTAEQDTATVKRLYAYGLQHRFGAICTFGPITVTAGAAPIDPLDSWTLDPVIQLNLSATWVRAQVDADAIT